MNLLFNFCLKTCYDTQYACQKPKVTDTKSVVRRCSELMTDLESHKKTTEEKSNRADILTKKKPLRQGIKKIQKPHRKSLQSQ